MKEYNQESIERELDKIRNEMKIPNVLICGQTGVGKSSVVNFLFKNSIAEIGEGEPCTRDVKKYSGEYITLFDSEGYEIGSEKQKEYNKMLFDNFLKDRNKLGDEDIHLVWYGISGAGTRYTELDLDLLKRIRSAGFKVGIILTKIDEMDEGQLNEMVKGLTEDTNDIPIFRLSIIDNKEIQEFCDWDRLVDWSIRSLDDTYKVRFVSGLRAGLQQKRKAANIAIAAASAASVAVGASPIPFSDAAVLVPIQTGLMIKILSIYGITIADSSILSLLGSAGVSQLGKSLAGNLIKLLPGVGSVIGAFVNSTVAGAFTGAIGKALEALCYDQCQKQLNGENITINIEEIITSKEFLTSIKSIFEAERV